MDAQSVVGILEVMAPDTKDKYKLTIVSDFFNIDFQNNLISTISFNYDTKSDYEITIKCEHIYNSSLFIEKVFTINILKGN